MLEKGLLRSDLLLSKLPGVAPFAVIEIDRVPAFRQADILHLRILRIPVERPPGKLLRLPPGITHRAVAELEDEARISDAGIGVFHASTGVGVVFRQHRDRHGIPGKVVDRDDIVRNEGDGIDRHQLTVDIEREGIVGVDVGLDRVGYTGLASSAA